jgi:hypothetical protein
MKIYKICFQASIYLDKYYKDKAEFEAILKTADIEILNYFNGFASSLIYKVKAKTKLFQHCIPSKIRKYAGVKGIARWTAKDERTWLLK